MFDVVTIVAFCALLFSVTTCSLNTYFVLFIFFIKKLKNKSEFSLIYGRFVLDSLYSLSTSAHLSYYFLRVLAPELAVKNLSFFIAWPNFVLGSIRSRLVLLITADRVLASCAPFFYHKNRPKISFIPVAIGYLAYSIFEQYIMFGICDMVIDIPIECNNFGCSVNSCYHNYWKWYEQIMQLCIGTLSVVLCFRLFVWNNCSTVASNKAISRATRISLLDSFMIFAFDFTPIFLMTHFPEVNFRSVGPLSAFCKNLGFVIEAVIIFRVLISNNAVLPASTSRTSRVFLATDFRPEHL
ncbi:Serpentine Receptor, class BC (Class B-like) [Caenorhabditis elegans]|uniref:Serpentine Receptor, class BC (Class B-like) n=1 Tax=Caenorhabditis elegans TaxID=6239 RepID=Q5F4U9_CAEEL|nr:Serpentine Receptor, class BC (Class B-like) [Caenorhabditis elegans]CCD63250.1 Serpentine Receptor, class BC (Class B-like) [Caenorhabditis elegans]|eukprot:NP_503324.2 Serpentine Receptor, class BC (class B-like) [Caenorhabditis elegans]